ncbi:hypothetical protein N0V90_012644 [Kalmusia sp. IMI 367209]|nr:hypothetical protein N0V90_012644 [Kalmusia sp. IMI 367209]
MAHHIEDRWLWLGLGVFTFFAIKHVSHGLRTIVTLTEVHKPPPPPTPHLTEDAIKTSSLQTLATCSNTEIRKAATKILLDRFVAHPSAYKHLIRDVHTTDSARQRRAYLAFRLLEEYGYVRHRYGVPPPTPVTHRVGGPGRWLRGTTRDRRNSDPLERDLRRRRREAMVINEGDRPISQEDVWMRDGEGRMSTEEQMGPRNAFEVLQAGGYWVDVETGELSRQADGRPAGLDMDVEAVWR